MIAIFLIGVAFVGVLAFINSSLNSNFEVKNELIAAGLAQEGVELVRNLADYKKLNDAQWSDLINRMNGLPACEKIDLDSLKGTHVCQNFKADKICFDTDGRYRQCSSGGESGIGLTRSLEITCEDSSNAPIASCSPAGSVKSLKIVSEVEWNDRTTTATGRLYENNY